MTPSSTSSSGLARSAEPPTAVLETRLRALVSQQLGMNADELVGRVSHLDDLTGEPDLPTVRVRAHLGRADGRGPRLGRFFRLDPYTLQILIDDAQRAGRGARLDVVVARNTPPFVLGAIRGRLAGLGRRGVDVRVRTERRRRDYSFLASL